jgi:hypothetical protein
MIKKTQKRKPTSPVATLTFEPGCYFEIIDSPAKFPTGSGSNHKQLKPRNAAAGRKNGLGQRDRQHLRNIEIWLNNCLNLVQGVETKRVAKIIPLLRDARDLAIRLRG